MLKKTNLGEAFEKITDYWNPHIAGELNDQHIKLAKIKGDFIWHAHENEDEMFLVIHGEFDMELRDGTVRLSAGDFLIVPKGTEHRPVARQEAHILLFEPKSTLNTGNQIESPMTRLDLKSI